MGLGNEAALLEPRGLGMEWSIKGGIVMAGEPRGCVWWGFHSLVGALGCGDLP
jgi:hypothetical protein